MKVLIATDGSKYSDAAIASVCERQWPDNCEFMAFSVAESLISMVDPMLVPHDSVALEQVRVQHHQYTQRAADQLRERFPAASVFAEISDGNAADQIVKRAEAWSADLIVVGSHGRHAIDTLLLGSVSEAVVRRAKCSVNVVKMSQTK